MESIYLDHAAATALDSEVLSAMQPYFSEKFYNPSAVYLAAKETRQEVENARARVAKILGARPREITFTAGATEANNLAIQGVMRKYPEAKVLVSAIEHSSVLEPAKQFNHEIIPVDNFGQVDLFKLKKMLDSNVVLVSVVYANNEIGSVQKLSEIKKLIDQELNSRKTSGNSMPLYLHTDAAQAPNLLSILTHKLGIDLMSLNGGKIYGPKQSGALYVRTGVDIAPIILGGGQEWNLRSGTENVAGIIGFSEALHKASELRQSEDKRMKSLSQYCIEELTNKLPEIQITNPKASLYNIVHILVPGHDNERLMMELDERGIMCAVGSACSASSDEPSHVLKAIGLSDELAQSSLRFSMGRTTTVEDIDKVVAALSELTT